MTREEIERQHKAGEISDADYNKYWKKSKAKHLEEVAVFLPGDDWEELKKWIARWGHKGGSWYGKASYAVRCGGANQHVDPLNVFFLRD